MTDLPENVDSAARLGAWLRTRIREAGATPKRLAAEIEGASTSTIYNWLAGRHLPPPPAGDRPDGFYNLICHPELGLGPAQRLRLEQLRRRITGFDPDPPSHWESRLLPAALPSFVGRARDLSWLDRRLAGADGSGPVVVGSLSGVGGVGKTALATKWARGRAARGAFPEGCVYVDLRGFAADDPLTPERAMQALLLQLDVASALIPADAESLGLFYRRSLEKRRLLLLLDNARDEEQVRPLLPAGTACRALVTSRRRLAGLAVTHDAKVLALDVLSMREATALLRRMLGFAARHAEADDLEQLASACGRLPLALRVAAAGYTAGHAPVRRTLREHAELLRRDRLGALTASASDPATVVANVLDWSCRALDDSLKRALRLLALHPGRDWEAGAAAALLDVDGDRARRLSEQLREASLLELTASGRFRFHDLVAEHARRTLAPDPESAEAAIARLQIYYGETALAASNLVYPFDSDRRPAPLWPVAGRRFDDLAAARSWLAVERENIMDVAAGADDGEFLGRLSVTMFRDLDASGATADALRLYSIGYERGGESWRGRAAIQLAVTLRLLGRLREAREYACRAVVAARTRESPVEECVAVLNLASVHLAAGRVRRASCLGRCALRLARNAEHGFFTFLALNNLAIVELKSSADKRLATALLEEALSLAAKLDLPAGQSLALGNLAMAHEQQGRLDAAVSTCSEALAFAETAEDLPQRIRMLANLTRLHACNGAAEFSDRAGARAAELAADCEDEELSAVAFADAALAHAVLGRSALAREAARQALSTMAERVDLAPCVPVAYRALGEVALRDRDLTEAREHFGQALAAAQRLGDCNFEAFALDGLARADSARDPDSARACWRRAESILRVMNPEAARRIREDLQRLG